MNRITLIAIASWSTALVAAGAFAYVLTADAPQPVASMMGSPRVQPAPVILSAEAAMHHESATLVVLPPTIITDNRRRGAMVPAPATTARQLSEMSCSGWRSLEQGSSGQMVRSCD
jgi:hypothetical protein